MKTLDLGFVSISYCPMDDFVLSDEEKNSEELSFYNEWNSCHHIG